MKRAHQRLSLKKKAVTRAALTAYHRGTRVDFSYVYDPYLLGNMNSITSSEFIVRYANAYYVFVEEVSSITLVTVMTCNEKKYGGFGCQ